MQNKLISFWSNMKDKSCDRQSLESGNVYSGLNLLVLSIISILPLALCGVLMNVIAS